MEERGALVSWGEVTDVQGHLPRDIRADGPGPGRHGAAERAELVEAGTHWERTRFWHSLL